MKPIDRGTWLALTAMGIAVFVIANDFSAINVAIPQIEQDFKTDVTTAQWVVCAYALTFGVLIVTGGRLADLFGRRRAFFIGTAIFAIFSVLGGAAQTETELIAMRVLMGIGGALMWPAILGMTYAALPEERAGLAGGFILGAAGIGNAAGPLIGGVLTDLLSWRWIFFLNLPVSAFAVFVTWRQIHQPRPEIEERRMDYLGIATVSIGLVSLLLAFDQANDWGWGDPRIIAFVAVFVVLIGSFAFVERRAGEHALVPPDVIRNRDFAYTCLAILLMSAVFFAAMLYLPQFMIKVLGYSPIGAGAGMLPMMATFAAVSFVAGNLYNRFGAKPLLIVGSLCIAVGPTLIALLAGEKSFGAIVPGLAVLGLGIGLFYPTATTVGVTAVDEARRSLAGAIIYMFQIAGGSVGLGLTTTVFIGASDRASGGDAFIDGLQTALAVDAAIAVGGFLIAAFLIGGRMHLPQVHRPALAGHSPRGHGP
ncbi:MAG TPA: DHA2 family efflux MFS transporter permease subunit [Solirubrobacterales bacterium]|nr:DHA2 family efflux MFS transporter permease subunit [Solirubrobacterales bacterium]